MMRLDGSALWLLFLCLLLRFEESVSSWVPATDAPTQSWKAIASDASGQYLAAIPSLGYVYISRDYGQQWIQISSLPNTTCVSISMDSSANYLLLGSHYLMYYSWDMGNTWSSSLPYLLPSSSMSSIAMVSNGNENFDFSLSSIEMIEIEDKLKLRRFPKNSHNRKDIATSELINTLLPTDVDSPKKDSNNVKIDYNLVTNNAVGYTEVTWNQVMMATSNHNYISLVSDYGVYSSSNGGLSWQVSAINPTVVNNHSVELWKHIAMDSTGKYQFASVENTMLYHSSNYGQTWQELASLALEEDVAAIAMNGNGSLVTTGSILSSNSGKNFSQSELGNHYWTDLCSDSTGNLLVACSNTGIWLSRNHGMTWIQTSASSTAQFTGITCSADGTKIMASSKNGGLWFSYTMGYSWLPLLSPTVTDSYHFLDVVTATTNTALYATINGSHVFLLKNAGQSVTSVSLSSAKALSKVFMSSSGTYIFVLTTTTGYYYSKNSGVNFVYTATTNLNGNGQNVILNSVAMSTDMSKVYASSKGQGLYISTTQGTSFKTLVPLTNVTFNSQAWSSISCDNTGQYVVAAVYGSTIWLSKDYGKHWQASHAISNAYNTIVMASNAPANVAVITYGNYIYQSIDYGNTFSFAPPSGSWEAVVSNAVGNIIVGVQDMHVLVSTNSGKTYRIANIVTPKNANVEPMPFSSLAISSNGMIILAACMNDGIFLSQDTGMTWSYAFNTSNIVSVAMSSSGDYFYALNSVGKLFTSSGLGKSWQATTLPALPPSSSGQGVASTPDATVYYASITTDSTGQFVTVASTHSVLFFSQNYGITWTFSSPQGYISITHIPSKNANSTMMVNGRLYQSLTNGGTWTSLSTSPLCINAVEVSLISDSTGRIMYLSSVQCVDVYTSIDYGHTWMKVTNIMTSSMLADVEGSSNTIGWLSMACSSTAQVVAAINQNGTLFLTSTQGQSWNTVLIPTSTMNTLWSSISMDSTGQYITVVSTDGLIYTSYNTGQNWVQALFSSETPNVIFTSVVTSADGQYLTAVSSTGEIYTSSNYGYLTNAPTMQPTMHKQDDDNNDQLVLAIVLPIVLVCLAIAVGLAYYYLIYKKQKNNSRPVEEEKGFENVVNQLYINGTIDDTDVNHKIKVVVEEEASVPSKDDNGDTELKNVV